MLTRKSLAGALTAGLLCLPAAVADAAPADLDRTFGGGAFALPLDDTGIIDVVALRDGVTVALTDRSEVVRLRADGTLDPTFGGGDGRVRVEDAGGRLAVDAEGRILVPGYTYNGTDNDAALTRLTPTGELDATFGDGGVATLAFSPGRFDGAVASAVLADGRILVTGNASQPSGVHDIGVARLTPKGELDPAFSDDGKVVQSIGNHDAASNVGSTASGRIVVAGSSTESGGRWFPAALALTDRGALDTGYAGDGTTVVDFGADPPAQVVQDAVVGPDGSVVVGGQLSAGLIERGVLRSRAFVARISPQGSADKGFGTGGLHDLGAAGEISVTFGVALQPDGAVVAAGGFQPTTTPSAARPFVARLTPAGARDTTFAGGTRHEVRFGDEERRQDILRAAAVAPDGRITVAGESQLRGPVEDRGGDDRLAAFARFVGKPDTPPPGGGGGGTPPSQEQPAAPAPAPGPRRPRAVAPRVTLGQIARRPKVFTGTASGASRVEVAIVRKRGKRCATLTSTAKLRFGKAACTKPKWLKATGTTSWRLTLKRALGRGTYQLLVRPVGADGTAGTPVRRAFRVR